MLRRLPAEPLAGVAAGTPAATLADSDPLSAAPHTRPGAVSILARPVVAAAPLKLRLKSKR
ncbi:MAG: hypothetical protein OXP09_20410 [Gammaproteobacteria bacterium]|nr:hypothetical protein [Gammaproteobacteria bacterium]MDE0367922.1 hypothetical protein [Gammaproteobacteria bacterium]